MTDTHHAIEAHPTCVVPSDGTLALNKRRDDQEKKTRTNLIATGWLEMRLTPRVGRDYARKEKERKGRKIPSKTTPKDPSPIFFPTRK
jgi:hypothetical protein